jgi:DNA polymerase III epsilon subunit-like protein
MINSRVAFVDVESTGRDPDVHEIWEIGLIARDHTAGTAEFRWLIEPSRLRSAEPDALRIGRYYQRTADVQWSDPARVAYELARLIDGAVVVGSNPGFDKDFLRPFLADFGQAYTAHYRPLCVTTVAYGYLCGRGEADGLRWPLSSDEVSSRVGVDPAGFDRHTALGDCHWAAAVWDTVTLQGDR